MSILNDYYFDVAISRAGKPYVGYLTEVLSEDGDVESEIGGGAALATVKAHRRFSLWINMDYDLDLLHKLLLLRHDDVLDVAIALYRTKTIIDLGFISVTGTKIQIPVLQPLRHATDALATLALSKCRFMHQSPDQAGYSFFFSVQGDAKLNVGNQTFTSGFELAQ
jgi:hypothetical protein